MKKIIILIGSVIIIIVGIIVLTVNFKKTPIIINITNFNECLAANNMILESYPRQCKTSNGQTFDEDIGNELDKSDLIIINSPRPNQEINSPLIIEGQARGSWYFEASFPVKLYDENNNLIAQGIAQAQGDWMTENFVPFKAELNFNSSSTIGTLVLEKDNPSGLTEHDDQLSLPVNFSKSEKTKVRLYFSNNNLDPGITCDKVFSVEREINKTPAIARATLEELLSGVTSTESETGFSTNLNPDIKIQKLTIENGIAKVDFNKQLEDKVAGSCRVTAIRAQINETLKQFSTVNSVIISIDGHSEDILQP